MLIFSQIEIVNLNFASVSLGCVFNPVLVSSTWKVYTDEKEEGDS